MSVSECAMSKPPRYVKRSIALACVATSFMVGFPATELASKLLAKIWTVYGAYIRMWLEQHATFFVVLCLLCGVVVSVYGIILVLEKQSPMFDLLRDEECTQLSLREHFKLIQELVDFDQLLPQLFQDKILTYDEDISKIRSEPTRACKTMTLVYIIEEKHKVKGFIESLEKETQNLGHRELALVLKQAYPKLFPVVSDESDSVADEAEHTSVAVAVQPAPSRPKLHLDPVMDTVHSFSSDSDARYLKAWGLQIFPSEPLDGSTLFIAACLVGNFEFPPYYELVSPVFYFWSEENLSKLLKLDMQHSVDAKSAKQATCLRFAAADTSNGPPFKFALVEGGIFNPKSSNTGVISTRPEGLLAIVKRKLGRFTLRTEPQIRYEAHIFYTWDTPTEYECTAHFIITPSTSVWLQALTRHFNDAVSGNKMDISFIKSSISLSIPDEGVLVKGWKITCTTSKTITYDAVTKTTDTFKFQECKLSIKWVGDGKNEDLLPTDVTYNLPFSGSHHKKSESFIRIQAHCSKGNELRGLYG